MFCNTPTVEGLSNQFLGAIHLLENQKYRGCFSLSLCVNVRRSVGRLEEQCAVYQFVNGFEINDCVCECVCVCRSSLMSNLTEQLVVLRSQTTSFTCVQKGSTAYY